MVQVYRLYLRLQDHHVVHQFLDLLASLLLPVVLGDHQVHHHQGDLALLSHLVNLGCHQVLLVLVVLCVLVLHGNLVVPYYLRLP